jgi:hypothetical protein
MGKSGMKIINWLYNRNNYENYSHKWQQDVCCLFLWKASPLDVWTCIQLLKEKRLTDEFNNDSYINEERTFNFAASVIR